MRGIQQVNLLLGQWKLRQQFHVVTRANCICRQKGGGSVTTFPARTRLRRRNQQMAIFQNPSHHHGFMGNGTGTERNIDSVFNQIDAPFGRVHLQLNVRVLAGI